MKDGGVMVVEQITDRLELRILNILFDCYYSAIDLREVYELLGVRKDWKKYVVRTALRKLIREGYIDGRMPRILQKDPRYEGMCSFAISDKGRREILEDKKTAEEETSSYSCFAHHVSATNTKTTTATIDWIAASILSRVEDSKSGGITPEEIYETTADKKIKPKIFRYRIDDLLDDGMLSSDEDPRFLSTEEFDKSRLRMTDRGAKALERYLKFD
jgi:hypothetical protein